MEKMEASFNVLIMSIGSSAAMAMGLQADPQTGKIEVDKNLARFNIDLLSLLKDKTKNNLTADENNFLDAVISDLKSKFIALK
ncbi:MAG: DUF1844 domain-containing protein [Pseudobdellovibrio sp.]|nr:DUF1844 domain-containing protein [Pseudobdellovibrio sp.]